MPSAFSHAVAAVAMGRGMLLRDSIKLWLFGIFCAIIPDADAIGFHLGVPYGNPFGHRGFTHSFLFAFFLAIAVVLIFYRHQKIFSRRGMALLLFFFLAGASHGILDAFTNGGLGVAFFFPFDNTRYFFPWRPIKVSPISITAFFSERGVQVLKSELLWIWTPSLLIIALSFLWKRKKSAL
jgi:inner membrane protein